MQVKKHDVNVIKKPLFSIEQGLFNKQFKYINLHYHAKMNY